MTAKRVDALLDLLADHLVELARLRKQEKALQGFREWYNKAAGDMVIAEYVVADLDKVLNGDRILGGDGS